MPRPKNENISIFVLCRLSIIIFFILGFFNSITFSQDRILAIVDNEIITQKDFDDFLRFMHMQLSDKYKGQELQDKLDSMKKDLLDRLIDDKLLLQEAKRENIKLDENRIKTKIEQIRKRYPSDTLFQEALRMQGLTQADIEAKMREQSLIYTIVDTKIRSKIAIKPQEVTNFYKEHIQDFAEPEQKEIQSLAIKDLALAQRVSEELKDASADFSKVAYDYSLEPKNLGPVEKGQFRYEIEKAVSDLGLNESSKPVNIDGIYYIFNVKQIIPPRQLSLNEASEAIYNLIFEKKMQERLSSWLDELKSKSYIKIQKD